MHYLPAPHAPSFALLTKNNRIVTKKERKKIIFLFFSPCLHFFLIRYLSFLGNGAHRAGGRLGNDKHYIEQHERGNKNMGAFQKKVKVSQPKKKIITITMEFYLFFMF